MVVSSLLYDGRESEIHMKRKGRESSSSRSWSTGDNVYIYIEITDYLFGQLAVYLQYDWHKVIGHC